MKPLSIIENMLRWIFSRDNRQNISNTDRTHYATLDERPETLNDIINENPPAISEDYIEEVLPLRTRINKLYTFFNLLNNNPGALNACINIARKAQRQSNSSLASANAAEFQARDYQKRYIENLTESEANIVIYGTRFLCVIRRDFGDDIFERVVTAFKNISYQKS